jgi:hypothetical protein
MFEREIHAAALRWHTTHVRRLAATAQLYQFRKGQRQRTGYWSLEGDLSQRVTELKRLEQAALRALAKVCAGVRGSQHQVSDAHAIDLPVLRIG